MIENGERCVMKGNGSHLNLECRISTRQEGLSMSIAYMNRSLEPVLKQAVSEFPPVVLTGPQHSGMKLISKIDILIQLIRIGWNGIAS